MSRRGVGEQAVSTASRNAAGRRCRAAAGRGGFHSELGENEQTYELVLRSISDAVFITDDAGALTFVCPNVVNIFGRSAEEVRGLGNVAALLGDGLFDPAELRRRGELENIAVDVFDKAGVTHNLLVNVKRVSVGRATRLYSCRDVTERKRAEQALQQERQRLAYVLEAIPAFVYLQAPDYAIRWANRRFVQRFGEPGGRRCHEVIAGRDQPCPQCPTFQVFTSGQPQEWSWTSADGRSYMIYDMPLADVDGGPLVLEMGIEITEHQRAEERLRQREAELAHASRVSTIGEMATSLAHELNQPLAAVCAYADACLAKLRSGSVQSLPETIEAIAGQAQQAAQIVRRVREFCRKEPPARQPVDVNRVIRDALGLVEAELRRQDVRPTIDLAPRLGAVLADPIQLQQVILNLVRNAVDAIRQSPESERNLAIASAARDARMVLIDVRDDGIGLDEAAMARIFEPFHTTKPQGMGLGLAISRTIVKSHGGKLWATKNADRGVTFHLALPAGTEEARDAW
jgi:PAS domain S-box-containing protein